MGTASGTARKRSTSKTPRRDAGRAHLRVVRPDERPARVEDRVVGLLLLSSASLVLVGVVMVLSASSVSAYDRFGSSFLFFNRHVVFALLGVGVAAVTARMRYGVWERLCVPALLGSIGLLALVLHPSAGRVAGGSARWIGIGPITIQPSEFAKLAVVAFAATLLARRWQRIEDPRWMAMPLVPVVGVVVALIMLQPDLGTAIIVVGSVFVLLFAAGARLKHLLLGGAATITLGLAAIATEGYRLERFLSFLNPWADPQGNGYQTIQSLIGFGSGGLFGVGLGASRQKWMTLPNAHTDFIYSIIGEELGLIGALLVLVLFGVFIYAGIRIALGAPDAFGRLLAAGIVGWLGLQAVINLGGVTGLLPITGVPLPFVSFGGSALIVSMAAVGILVAIARARPARARRR